MRIPRIPSPWKMWRIRKQPRRNLLKGRWVKTLWQRCEDNHIKSVVAQDDIAMVIGLVIILLITVAVVVVKVTIIDAKPDLNVSTFRPLAQQVLSAVLGGQLGIHWNLLTISAFLTESNASFLTESNACAGAFQQQVHRCGLHSLQRICALSGNTNFDFVDSMLIWNWLKIASWLTNIDSMLTNVNAMLTTVVEDWPMLINVKDWPMLTNVDHWCTYYVDQMTNDHCWQWADGPDVPPDGGGEDGWGGPLPRLQEPGAGGGGLLVTLSYKYLQLYQNVEQIYLYYTFYTFVSLSCKNKM